VVNGRALIHGIGALIKGTRKLSSPLSTMSDPSQKIAIYEPGGRTSLDVESSSVLISPPSRTAKDV
jgi:hypothetical protein